MALIVVMEDDALTRKMVGAVLRRDGHEVLEAEDGHSGLALVSKHRPDLIVSDVQMPGMNGFQMLAELRSNPGRASIPAILLTSLQERAHMRIGMTAGADDYLTKPFNPRELREAVAAQLNKRRMQAAAQAMVMERAVERAVDRAVSNERERLMRLYEERLAAELSERWPTQGQLVSELYESATVLFVDIANATALGEKLSPDEMGEVARLCYSRANEAAYLFGAHHIQFVGAGLLAVFTDDANTDTVNHALRAVRTGLALIDSAPGIERYLQSTYPERFLPPFVVRVGLNSGPVSIAALADPLTGGSHTLPVGDATTLAMQLQKQADELGWGIVASVSTVRSVTGAVRLGRRAMLQLRGRKDPVDAAEILGLAQ